MARIKIKLPEKFIYECEYPISIGDINYGGHLSNDSLLRIAHDVRIRFLNTLDFSELDIGGVGLIMSDAMIFFKSQAYHQETLIIKIALEELSNFGFDLLYHVIKKQSLSEVARIKTGMVAFDYKKNKITPLTNQFKNKIKELNLPQN